MIYLLSCVLHRHIVVFCTALLEHKQNSNKNKEHTHITTSIINLGGGVTVTILYKCNTFHETKVMYAGQNI
jgi:hypothetical protein